MIELNLSMLKALAVAALVLFVAVAIGVNCIVAHTQAHIARRRWHDN